MFVFDSVFVSVAGEGFTIVVLVSFFSVVSPPAGGLVTVVSFCSQAASSAAPIRMQMYFFIMLGVSADGLAYGVGDVAGDSAVAGGTVVSGAAVAAGLSAGVTVSVFCSQAASNAALARIQMYFFILRLVEEPIYAANPESRQAAFSVLPGIRTAARISLRALPPRPHR
jgi:hypothetical protein